METEKKQLKEQGFLLLKDVLSPAECEHYVSLLEENYKAYSPYYVGANDASKHGLENKSTEKVVFNLHNKNYDWYTLFEHPKVLPILNMTLKDGSYLNAEPFNLLNISARNPLKGNKGQQLHLDSNLPGGDFPLIMVVIFLLNDFTKDNGATRLVPGSHRFPTYAENGKKYEEEILIEARKGSVLIYNASLWHGGSEKMNDENRWGLILGYGRWFVKPSFDFMSNMPKDMYEKLTDSQKDLLGYRSNPPKDEFTRMRRRSESFDVPFEYSLPK